MSHAKTQRRKENHKAIRPPLLSTFSIQLSRADPKAWKADTTSAGGVGPGDLIKEDAKGPEGRHIKNKIAKSNHEAITGTNNAARHQNIGYRDLGFYPFRVGRSLLASIPGRRSALPWDITFGPLGAIDFGKTAKSQRKLQSISPASFYFQLSPFNSLEPPIPRPGRPTHPLPGS